MAQGGSASMNIQWIEAVYNKSSDPTLSKKDAGCQNVCDVGKVPTSSRTKSR